MQHEITHTPSFAMLRVDLEPGETVVAEAGAMVARSPDVSMAVKLSSIPGQSGGIVRLLLAIVRKLMGGESLICNHFTASSGGSKVWFAPTLSGSLTHRRLNGEELILSSGAYVASTGNVDVAMKFGGLKSLLAKEGAFMLRCTGTGDLWFNSYGGIETIELNNGSYIVDNGHLVGYDGQLRMSIRRAGGGLMGSFASGEGLVCEFSGTGRVYLQSRNLSTFTEFVSRIGLR
jgi:uncharacterized protein (TIGR00266 family)